MSANPVLKHVVALNPLEAYRQLQFEYDQHDRILWGYMKPVNLPNFNLELLKEMNHFEKGFETSNWTVEHGGERRPVDFYVAASKVDGVFNLGGDLGLFMLLIKARDAEGLTHYGRLCVDNVYRRAQDYGSRSVTTIALVQGDALGGGFELALANDVIVAERHVKMGFPEILFNLFPGMGAISLLSRKIGVRDARAMIASGAMYTAEELHAMKIVDVLAETGQGEQAVGKLIRKTNDRSWNGLRGMHAGFREVQPLQKEELNRIVDVWVQCALELGDKDLRMMERIVNAQKRRMEEASASTKPGPALSVVA